MRVRRADEDPFDRDAGVLGREPPGRIEHVSGNAEAVHDDDREARGAIVEHQAARVQFVVDPGRRERRPAADDRPAEWRRDVAGGGAGLQPRRLDVSPRLRNDRLRR